MSASQHEDRARLDVLGLEIFENVRQGATSEQWREWLRVPLEHAAAAGNLELFTKLVDAGANASAGWRGCHGRTLLGAAAAGKNEEIVLALVKAGGKPDLDVKFGSMPVSALHVAAACGAQAAFTTLMLAGADPNVVDWKGMNPLHVAAEEGHAVIVSDLLEKGADPNAKTCTGIGYTPLHLAAHEGRLACVSRLLRGGADKDSRSSIGETPLFVAARRNQLEVVEKLLAAKADPDIRIYDDRGGELDNRRALDVAANDYLVDVLRALLRHGSDINACGEDGYTALHFAAYDTHINYDVDGEPVRVLLGVGDDVGAKMTDTDCPALHLGASAGRVVPVDTMRALLEGGANVNARDRFGATPLHDACDFSNADGVELLLRWGADETLMEEDGGTAADAVGQWEKFEEESIYEDQRNSEDPRKVNDQRIRQMLARAPADRSWRRRGWLVLARYRPARVQLANDSRSGSDGSSTKVAKARCDGLSVGEGGDGDQAMASWVGLVRRVVGMDEEGVFRLVIGFL